MHSDVRHYITAIPAEQRELFDRLHALILEERPDAQVVLSYRMPTYTVGRRRLFVGVWRHGISIYGWQRTGDGGFSERHPEFVAGKGTIRLSTDDAADIPDDDFRDLVRAVLGRIGGDTAPGRPRDRGGRQ